MKSAQFVNFIAFGKRNSIDLRVVVYGAGFTGSPVHLYESEEFSQTASCHDIHTGFNEMARSCFMGLVNQLRSKGCEPVAAFLESLKEEAEEESNDGRVRFAVDEFAMWVSFLASLNETKVSW